MVKHHIVAGRCRRKRAQRTERTPQQGKRGVTQRNGVTASPGAGRLSNGYGNALYMR